MAEQNLLARLFPTCALILFSTDGCLDVEIGINSRRADSSWLGGMPSGDADLELRAFRVHAPAAAALAEMLGAIQAAQMTQIYAVRSRIKPVSAIIEKCMRKRQDPAKQNYEPEDVTDIVGIRFVTLFREDIIEVAKLLLRMIKHEDQSAHSPFLKGALKEKIVYTTASIGDPEAITSRLRAAFDSAGFPLLENEVKQVETGYSSVHLVAQISSRTAGEMQAVPIEVQIRTVFEDAWGEIDHKLRYASNRQQVAAEKAFLESWQPHLNVLKSFTDGCAQYAGIIKNHAIDAQNMSLEGYRPLKPVETVEDALQQIGEVSAELRGAINLAYARRKAATDARS